MPSHEGSAHPMIILSLGVAGILAYYFIHVAKKPIVSFIKNELNDKLVASIPALHQKYFATPWMFNTHMQLFGFGLLKSKAKPLQYDTVDVLETEDGGQISVDWLGIDLPETTPTVIVLHTISGDPQSMRGIVRYLHDNMGWRVALCVRRGHGDMALKTPKFNTMGIYEDTLQQINHIHTCFSQSPLYAVGVSAGSGAIASYLGKVQNETPVKGAVAYCPAYDMRDGFSRALPFYSKMMTKKLKRLFVTPNESLFQELEAFQKLKDSEDMQEFHQYMFCMSGDANRDEYMRNSNPIEVFDDIKIPTLILNSRDDPVCHIDNANANKHRMDKMSNVLFVMTERGSHCAFFEGLTAKPWASKLIMQYFLALERNLGE